MKDVTCQNCGREFKPLKINKVEVEYICSYCGFTHENSDFPEGRDK